MNFKDIFIITKSTMVIAGISLGISVIAILSGIFYYRALNKADDPQLLPVRKWIEKSENLNNQMLYKDALLSLDSALTQISKLQAYQNSYEIGVIYNNMASVYISKALYDSSLLTKEKVDALNSAKNCADSSIRIYQKWITDWGHLSELEIMLAISKYYESEDQQTSKNTITKILKKRISSILEAQKETPRRLSVSYTNLGTIYRHLNQGDSALISFQHALDLWKHNQVAISNLKVLLGGKPEKPSIIRQLFPPDKND